SYCTIYALISLSFSVSCSRAHRDLHSFPTRRSSDLGSFGGVVVQTMKLSVLNGLFASFELGRDSGIYIFLNDGRIVTGYPYTPGQMGQSLSGTANFERFIKERHGNFTGIAALGGMEQLYVYRTLEPFPLIVSVAQASASI